MVVAQLISVTLHLRKTFDSQEWQVYEFYSHYNTLSCRQVMRVINEQTKGFALTELFRTNQQRCALTIVRKIVLGSQVWKNYVKSYTLFTPKLHHVSQLFCQTETVFFIKLLKMMFADFKLSTMKIKVHAYLNPNSKF